MSDTRCDTTDLFVDQCAHCAGHTSIEDQVLVERAELLHQPGWFPARHGGTCRRCGEPFAPDTAIRRREGREGYIAECCADPEPATIQSVAEQPASDHECPAPGCDRAVPPHQFACARDWFRLPYRIRQAISAAYGRDSAAHALAMRSAVEWYQEHAGVRS
jgi:hypothetical protein